jgi:type I restriction enzyme S subunit
MIDWPVKTLDALCDEGVVLLGRGNIISKKDIAENPGPYPIYSSARENEGKFGEYGAYMFNEEMITWSIDGGGRLFYRPKHKFSVTNVGGTLRVLKPEVLEIRYLYRALENLHSQKVFDWVFKAHPSVIRKVYDKIPIPPLDEQQRIVALLDAATARVTELTSCYEQSRTHANNLFVSALRDSLASNPDWPVKTLGEVCSIKSVLVDPKDLKYSGMIHIGAGNIEAKTGRLFGIKTAREEKLISGKFLYSENDVLYSKIRPYLEKVALPAQAGLCSADIYPLQPGPLLTRMFLFYTLVSETFTEYAISGSSRTGMPKVNREHLFKYEMKVPPLAVQTEIVERLDATRIKKSEMVAAYDAKLTAVRNLRQSILEAAISGDL